MQAKNSARGRAAGNGAAVTEAPILDDIQAGHLRHMLNLAARLPDDWSGMMGRTTLQEDFGSLRFQLAYMAYALALTHVHRLPAAPVVFRAPYEALMQKMLSPDVWVYWHYVSTGNGPFNRSLGERPALWDPVETDNIMYSGYVQSMALLYHYLFRDSRYAQPDALTFSINPLFWSLGGKHFKYNEKSLNQHIYWSMVERGYLGIACEPNCVFQICNQIPILGFRFHDLVYGGDLADEVTKGYLTAWSDFGVLNEFGHYNMMVQEHERRVITPDGAPWTDFWVAALMHAWNSDFVKQHYPKHLARWAVDGPGGTLAIRPAKALSGDALAPASARDLGWAAVCASEIGDTSTLERLLAYADRFLDPHWDKGGRYYPRRDDAFDSDGNPVAMDPHTGNVLIGYARLNVPNGLKTLYESPLDDEHFSSPALVGMTAEIDVRQAWFDRERQRLTLTIGPIRGKSVTPQLAVGNCWGRGDWTLKVDGHPLAAGTDDAVSSYGGHDVKLYRADHSLMIEMPVNRLMTLTVDWLSKK
ncbi:linalool dehydratase/isomerase domain-containing protein [Burkholderia sp. PU8-34]